MTHSNYLGERISFGGTGALAAAGDPSVWDKITPEQQMWVGATLVKLNDLIVKATKTTCPDFGSTVNASLKCFQYWFNAGPKGAITKADGSKLLLRTDGYLDQETLDTLIAVTKLTANVKNFPTPFPATPTAIEKKGLSTGAMVGIGVAGATVLGGIIYAATRGKKARRSRRK